MKRTVPTLAWVIGLMTALVSAAAEPTVVPPVRFTPAGGVFTDAVNVTLATGAGTIRFTLDGSEPTPAAARYTKPIRVAGSVVLKARVFDAPGAPTNVLAQSYTLIDPALVDFNSNLPLVIVNTYGRSVDNLNRAPASIRFIEPRAGRSTLLTEADFDGLAGIKVRGHSSLRYPKRSYGFKTTDSSGSSLKASILGLPKDNDWILYAPYPDKTLMRDVLAYEMSAKMGHYAARTRFVEVFMNDGGGRLTREHYVGVYVFEEKIKRDKNRVNIAKLEPQHEAEPEVTGGYIFKKDHLDRQQIMEDNPLGTPNFRGTSSGNRPGYPTGPGGFPADPAGFQVARGSASSTVRRRVQTGPDGRPVVIEETVPRSPTIRPRIDPPPQARGNWLDELFRAGAAPGMERRSRSGTAQGELFYTQRGSQFFHVEPEADEIAEAQRRWLINHLNQFESALYGLDFKDSAKGYRAYLDVDSFIDQHLMVEVTKNIDGFRFSTFYHKDRGGKIKMQPVWDWNLSFGNANGKQGWLEQGWYWPQLDDEQYTWFRRLFEDPDFGQRYVDRYAELRRDIFHPEKVLARIDELAAALREAQARNFQRWPILGRKVWPNYFAGETYEEEIDWMKKWIARRIAWIDAQFLPAPQVTAAKSPGTGWPQIFLTGPRGEMYFTTDGSDPRAAGGAPAPLARAYSVPVGLEPGQTLCARTRLADRWSSLSRWPAPAN